MIGFEEDDAIRQWAERFLLQHGKIAVTLEELALFESAERDVAPRPASLDPPTFSRQSTGSARKDSGEAALTR